MIQVTFPDGNIRTFDAGTTAMQVAQSISEGLARNVLAALIDDQIKDASTPLSQDCTLQLLTWSDAEGKSTMWHSSAHLMAEALEFYYPGIKLAIGPPVTNGFYYDVDLMEYSISEKDLEKIEQKMKELAKLKSPFVRQEISKAAAIAYFEEKQDPYKLELLADLPDGSITFYTQGNFTDLCRGPHIPDTGFVKAVKLTAIAGAYWRGDEKNKQLTRIYGITFPKQAELTEYLERVEEAKRRDHR
ncbi:MAG: TGS domain-containing protein [Crocinitomicaceae bacterium]|nr:TGS domain-containing protein [Crocinitomicaceae bacterium]